MATSKLADLTEAIPLLDLDTDSASPSYNQYAAGRNSARDIRIDLLGAMLESQSAATITRPGTLARNWVGTASAGYWRELRGTAQGTPSRVITYPLGYLVASRVNQGCYLITQETDLNITMPAADGSLPRWDVVYALAGDKGAFGADTYHGPVLLCETGTPSASPVLPAIPSDARRISEVYRRAGATGDQIAQADITDKRRGTALAGTPRPLLGGDSLADVGGHHGDQRLRSGSLFVPSGIPLDSMIDRWSAIDSKWHGTQVFDLNAAANAATTNILNGAVYVAQTITIPDPGYEYYVAGGASVLLTGVPTNSAYNVQGQIRIGATTTASVQDGTVVAHGLCKATSASGSAVIDSPYGRAPNKQSGSITVNLLARNATGSTVAYGGSSLHNYMSLEIIPA